MLPTLLWIIALALVALLLIVATRPNSFRIERRATLPAAPEAIAAWVTDFHRWQAWSPWEHIDPTMQREFSGAAQGVGAMYAWSGTGKAGAGRMEVKHASAEKVTIQLDFFKPFEAHNTAEFSFTPVAGGTEVTWAMFGPNPFIAKLMQMFFSMEKLVGPDFEKGLAQLKVAVQKGD